MEAEHVAKRAPFCDALSLHPVALDYLAPLKGLDLVSGVAPPPPQSKKNNNYYYKTEADKQTGAQKATTSFQGMLEWYSLGSFDNPASANRAGHITRTPKLVGSWWVSLTTLN